MVGAALRASRLPKQGKRQAAGMRDQATLLGPETAPNKSSVLASAWWAPHVIGSELH